MSPSDQTGPEGPVPARDAAARAEVAEPETPLEHERAYVAMLYERLDDRRRETARRLAEVLHGETVGTPQALTERDAAAAMYTDRLAALRAAEHGLAFGRLDSEEGETRYIGRLGLLDEENEYEPLLMDWRAPAAQPFYTATAASPEGMRRRRHLRTRGRTVVAVDDEVLDLHDAAASAGGSGLTSEAALLSAVSEARTGRMGDIVATIQAEQDRIIRSKPSGVLVVQGGPGTGKTAVALHRAAYLLYTHRDRLARRGVLVIGPNPTFLRYIGQVLPSLGETSVVLATPAELYPGLHARRPEDAAAAEVKGRADMAAVIAAAVRDRQQVPRKPIVLTVDQQEVRLDGDLVGQARSRARRARKPHNEARRIFRREALRLLAEQVARDLAAGAGGRGVLGRGDVEDIRAELEEDPGLQRELDALWPLTTPERLLTELFADRRKLNSIARRIPAADRALLERPAPADDVPADLRWSAADVPLLDEAAELLGDDGAAARAAEQAALRAEVEYAQGVLDVLDLEEDLDPELLRATDIVDADRLADRMAVRTYESTADRAAADREWTYGHVIVDEAQELSAMAWRLVMRRVPSRSMTIVGDVAQTGDIAGASSWPEVLSPFVADRWRLEQLTVNYRTPAEIADVADDVLAAIDPTLSPPRSVRSTGVPPRAVRVAPGSLDGDDGVLAEVVREERDQAGEGRTAVLVPAARVDALRTALLGAASMADSGRAAATAQPGADAPMVQSGPAASAVRGDGASGEGGDVHPSGDVPGAAVSDAALSDTGDAEDLEAPVVVLPVTAAKGLEFDAVILVEPTEVLAESPRGLNDLYVALTRATQRLTVVHATDLPEVLKRLRPA